MKTFTVIVYSDCITQFEIAAENAEEARKAVWKEREKVGSKAWASKSSCVVHNYEPSIGWTIQEAGE